jgi:hypothetical protein
MAKYRLDLKTSPTQPPSHRGGGRSRAAGTLKSGAKVLLSVPFVIAVLYFGSVLYNAERVVPKGVETVQDFYRRYGNPPVIEALRASGRTFYRIIGEIPAPLGFPKGNPIYIFDYSGRLVDWTGASKGDPKFSERWQGAAVQQMPVADFLDRFPPE